MIRSTFKNIELDNEIIKFNKYLVDNKIVEKIHWRSGTMDSLEFLRVRLLISTIDECDQFDNILSITRFSEGLPFIYVKVKNIEKARNLVHVSRSRFNSRGIIFEENDITYKDSEVNWRYVFNEALGDKKESNKSKCHTVTINGIHIGNISIDSIRVESENDDLTQSIEKAFNGIFEKLKAVENIKTDSSNLEYKKDKCENISRSSNKSNTIDFIKECFSGYEIITMSIAQENIVNPVIDVLPEIKPFLDTIIGEDECSIIITNTGTVFFKLNEHCSMLSIRDGKRETQIVHSDFVDILTTGTNARHIAVELELKIK